MEGNQTLELIGKMRAPHSGSPLVKAWCSRL